MGLKLKIGKETIQGYTRELSSASMTDCYAYSVSALVALEFLKINKTKTTGLEMGFCISALRQVLFAKIKRDPNRGDRLPLGTYLWGDNSEIPTRMQTESLHQATGSLAELVALWGNHLKTEDD